MSKSNLNKLAYTDDYFKDQIAKSKLTTAIYEIMADQEYHIVILALQEVLTRLIKDYVIDGEIAKRWHPKEVRP